MLANFKKVSVAAAVAAALGASGAAQAVIESYPGDALLVPYVATNGAGKLNTMISVIVASPATVNVSQFPTLTGPKTVAGCSGKIHWYFFDKNSVEIVDDTIPVTCDDWVGIDFGSIVEAKKLPSALNVPGYMVIADASASETTASNKILYGAAYQIRGNWSTQAYIPVLPLIDDVDGASRDEVKHRGASFLGDVNPVTAGMLLADEPGEGSIFSLRYFLQSSDPEGSTEFVLWFPDNNEARGSQTVLVYNADEVAISARTSIPNELNVLKVAADAKVGGLYTGVITDGLADTGFVLFDVVDFNAETSAVNGNGSRAGVAFSLIGVKGSNVEQTQTELAHERGVQ
ncbi:MAG TPA: hypothetical protein P5102_09960 [Candidatus Competibacteraceae bacterium]|nr:hypothetical protein [Candidatus Competibacteraceae bacterium]HRZ06457.1 hypothetical protein [Candidatus Competibacteraceae bacterium]HSA45140.1 hypothetical protein [Candidatus Competibacteraceae bacterium]